MIDRPDLLKDIHSGPPAKLTLVTAPAGFGKTTLLVQWRVELIRRDIVVPWLSVSADDRHAIVLLRDIIDSIQFADSSIGRRAARRLNSSAGTDVTQVVNDLVNDLAEIVQPLTLFLDDYHVAANSETDELVELLLALSPVRFHLTIASRTRPKLSLARLRVRGELHEVTSARLRFTLSEANAFFSDVRRLKLSNDQVARLHEHSEGWVAGLQLASLALRDPERRAGFIASFSGRLQDIAEYLASDVLEQQPEAIQQFLLRTSVAGRLNAELSSYLTGERNARDLLDRLERDGLFITPLDPEHTWYRYHPLFQEFLLAELRRRYPAEATDLYRKTSAWFEAHGLMGEAVEYALLAGDAAKVVALVEQQAWLELMAGRMPRVVTWIGRIPEGTCNGNPKLLYLLCTALYHSNKVDEAERVLAKLVALADGRSESADQDDAMRLQEQLRLLRAGVGIARDELHRALEPLCHDFEHLNEFERGIASNIRGYALAELGQLDEATKSLAEARRHHELAGSEFGIIYSDCFLALADYARGNLEHCFVRFQHDETAHRVSEEKYVAPVPEIVRGVVLYQWNRLDEALERLQTNLPFIAEVGHIRLIALGSMALARIKGLQGDHRAAMQSYDRIFPLGARAGTAYERLRALVEADRIAYLLQSGRLNEAIDHALGCGVDADSAMIPLPARWERTPCLRALIWSRLQIVTGRPERALPVLRALRKLATGARRGMRVLESCLLEARARIRQDVEAATDLVVEAIALAAPNYALRPFFDEGKEICDLLLSINGRTARGWSAERREFLIALTNTIRAESPHGARSLPDTTEHGLVEPISDRELEVLRLMAAGGSNSLIAMTLAISENTVKWHVKNIFSKLAVANRTSAVAAARQMHLLR